MVRVIKPGKVPPKIVTCDQCNAVLQYTLADTISRSAWYSMTYLTCPLCGHEIKIEIEDFRNE